MKTRAESDRDAGRSTFWLAVFVAVFSLPRIAGLFTDFWLDEIWALDIVARVDRPLEIFTRVHFDTNHWLYSLWLFALGPREGWIAYRIPALLAGIASVPLLWAIARSQGRIASASALVLGGGSFLLIEYSSEARGYAPAVLFALAAFYASSRYVESGRVAWCAVFNLCCLLGLLSHLTFLFPYSGLLAWSVAREIAPGARASAALRRIAACHALPLACFAALYWIDIRHIQHGAGEETSIAAVVARLAALSLGLPDTGVFLAFATLLALALALGGIALLWRDASRAWLFHAVALIAAPALLVALRGRDFPYWSERHFLVCVPFLLLLAASLLGRLWERGRAGRVAVIAVLFLYLAGNSLRTVEFLRDGRGQYREAVEYLFANSTDARVTVGSDHDFRNSMLLSYYARFAPAGREIVYVPADAWPDAGPEWLIMHDTEGHHVAEPSYVFAGRVEYSLARTFPFSGVSGWHWDLYRRAD